jgi:hypothetical protein
MPTAASSVPIRAIRAGAIALASTKTPSKRHAATDAATASAAWGGQMLTIRSQRAQSAATSIASTSPCSWARAEVASLRPLEAQSTA